MDRRIALVCAVVALGGCARVTTALGGNGAVTGGGVDLGDAPGDAPNPSGSPPDLEGVEPADLARATAPPDLATTPTPPADMAAPPADMAAPPADMAAPPASACHLVINEVLTGTSTTLTDEFVEVYNPCPAAVTLDGWKLVYRATSNSNAKSGADSNTLFAFPSGTLASGAYRLLVGAGYSGTSDGKLASGLADAGAVGLRDGAANLIDSVAYGATAAASAFCETSYAPAPGTAAGAGHSIERLPNGLDANDNSHDFAVANTPTPGAANL